MVSYFCGCKGSHSRASSFSNARSLLSPASALSLRRVVERRQKRAGRTTLLEDFCCCLPNWLNGGTEEEVFPSLNCSQRRDLNHDKDSPGHSSSASSVSKLGFNHISPSGSIAPQTPQFKLSLLRRLKNLLTPLNWKARLRLRQTRPDTAVGHQHSSMAYMTSQIHRLRGRQPSYTARCLVDYFILAEL